MKTGFPTQEIINSFNYNLSLSDINITRFYFFPCLWPRGYHHWTWYSKTACEHMGCIYDLGTHIRDTDFKPAQQGCSDVSKSWHSWLLGSSAASRCFYFSQQSMKASVLKVEGHPGFWDSFIFTSWAAAKNMLHQVDLLHFYHVTQSEFIASPSAFIPHTEDKGINGNMLSQKCWYVVIVAPQHMSFPISSCAFILSPLKSYLKTNSY